MPRRADPGEAATVADLYLRARYVAVPSIPALVHDDDDVRQWFAAVVLPQRDVWVTEEDGVLTALLVLDGSWLDQLYVDPSRTGRGVGASLLDVAKQQRPAGLDLWAFQSNQRAIAFYRRHGFREVERTDGDNEERAPDVRLRWP